MVLNFFLAGVGIIQSDAFQKKIKVKKSAE
jgi:hypothetical protein